MAKKQNKIFEADSGWFKGKDKKLYRIIANNKINGFSKIIMTNKKIACAILEDMSKNYDLILLSEKGNVNGIKKICNRLDFNKRVFEDSIFCLPMVVIDTYHYYKNNEKENFIKDMKKQIQKMKELIAKS